MIPEEYLELSLAQMLILHSPKRQRTGATAEEILSAVKALETKIEAHGAEVEADQLAYLDRLLAGVAPR